MQLKYLTLIFCLFLIGCKKEDTAQQATIKQGLLVDLSKLKNEIVHFKELVNNNAPQKEVIAQFKKSRLAYKKLEWAVEYFIPETARFINGPALDEMELEENKFFEPNGFQVIEELIYPGHIPENRKELIRELNIMQSNIKQAAAIFETITISDDYVVDAIQQNVYRILTLGITGFDSPIMQTSIAEARQSLSIIPDLLAAITENDTALNELKKTTSAAMEFCTANPDFNSFERAVFITDYLNVISKQIAAFKKEENIKPIARNRVLRASAATLFDKDAFDVNGFIPSNEYAFTPEKAVLGEKLFYENAFSKDKTRSCASCHNPEKAFTDGLKTNISLTGSNLTRNTPTLAYASLQNAQFWDMRQLDLEKQSMDVIQNKDEMHGSLQTIVPVIRQDTKYKKLFDAAFPDTKAVEEWQIQNAIASYIRSLNAFDSKFDGYMRNKNTLSESELLGFNLFAGKAKCATCHFIPLFNGTVPPNFSKTEQEVIGTPTDKKGTAISSDPGRYSQYKMAQLLHAFKTPTLRNVAITGPYMHNGVFTTLEEVVDFYNKGGGTGLGLTIDNQTLPPDQLNLTKKEQQALVAFMRTFTDKKYVNK